MLRRLAAILHVGAHRALHQEVGIPCTLVNNYDAIVKGTYGLAVFPDIAARGHPPASLYALPTKF